MNKNRRAEVLVPYSVEATYGKEDVRVCNEQDCLRE